MSFLIERAEKISKIIIRAIMFGSQNKLHVSLRNFRLFLKKIITTNVVCQNLTLENEIKICTTLRMSMKRSALSTKRYCQNTYALVNTWKARCGLKGKTIKLNCTDYLENNYRIRNFYGNFDFFKHILRFNPQKW